jgi:hypothetical protein
VIARVPLPPGDSGAAAIQPSTVTCRFLARRCAPLLPLFFAACATARFTVPAGPATPAPEAVAAWETATAECRAVRTARATMRLAARAGDRRVPRVRVGAAFDDGRALALQAESFFTLRGPTGDATLVMRDGRFVRAPVPDIVHALVDVRLDAARLLAILTGCVMPDPRAVSGERRDGYLVVRLPDGIGYLHQSGAGPWQVRAGSVGDLDIHYARRGPVWPRDITLTSTATNTGPTVSITISGLDIYETNGTLAPGLFEPVIPPGATEMTIDELRRTLGGTSP